MKKEKNNYKRLNRSKFLLKYHVILSVKYRKNILKPIGDDVKLILKNISDKYDFQIEEIEIDGNHIHMMVDSNPKIKPNSIIRILKSKSTIDIWKIHGRLLSNNFWKEKTFWADGYFICTIGDASIETIRNYIRNQG